MACVKICEGPKAGQSFSFLSDLLIGRSNYNPVNLEDERASRQHAHIIRKGTQFFIEDLGSRNGTFVQKTRLPAKVPYPLHDGDVIYIGTTKFIFSAEASQEQPYIFEQGFLSILNSHKYAILAIFLATVITVTIGTLRLPPIYEATSSLLVKFGREYIYLPAVGDGKAPSNYFNREGIVGTEIEILTSRDLSEKVIQHIGISKIYPQLVESPPSNIPLIEAAIHRFQENLSVNGSKQSDIIRVSFENEDAKITATALNSLIDFFKEKHLRTFSDPHASAFLEARVHEYQQRLQESEEQLEAFKQHNLLFSLDEQRMLLLRQRADLKSSAKTAENEIAELQERFTVLSTQIKKVPENTSLYSENERYQIIDSAKNQLLTLRLKEQELLGKFTENNYQVANVRKEIALARNFLQSQEANVKAKVRIGKNVVHQDIERELIKTKANLRAQEAKSAVLTQQLYQMDEELQALTLQEKGLRNLQRERDNYEQNYRLSVAKLEEARIADEMNQQKMTNISVIQAATVPTKPVKPKKKVNIAIGMVLGAAVGIGFALFRERLWPRLMHRRALVPHYNPRVSDHIVL